MRREFRDLTVKEALCDLETILDLGDRRKVFEKYDNRLVNEMPFDELGELSYNLSGFITDTWFINMDSFGPEGVAHYKQECEKLGVPWLDYRKYCPCHDLITAFALRHIEEISLAFATFDTYIHFNLDNPDIFKSYSFEGPKRKIGPIHLKGKTIESDFLDDLTVEVCTLIYDYYCFGKHPFENDDEKWESLKADTERVIKNVQQLGKQGQEEGVVII